MKVCVELRCEVDVDAEKLEDALPKIQALYAPLKAATVTGVVRELHLTKYLTDRQRRRFLCAPSPLLPSERGES